MKRGRATDAERYCSIVAMSSIGTLGSMLPNWARTPHITCNGFPRVRTTKLRKASPLRTPIPVRMRQPIGIVGQRQRQHLDRHLALQP